MRRVFSILDVLPPGTICTETYLVVDVFDTEDEAARLLAYLKTRFVRFLVAQLAFSQDIFKSRFSLVPHLAFDEIWTDKSLADLFELNEQEVAFIESKIKPWDVADAG